MEKLLEEFMDWSDRNAVHLNRHISIANKQTDNLRAYVELFQKYPANSIEFKVEVEKLLFGIGELANELQETTSQFSQDAADFMGILDGIKQEFLKRAHE